MLNTDARNPDAVTAFSYKTMVLPEKCGICGFDSARKTVVHWREVLWSVEHLYECGAKISCFRVDESYPNTGFQINYPCPETTRMERCGG